jgi:hypothetical protein
VAGFGLQSRRAAGTIPAMRQASSLVFAVSVFTLAGCSGSSAPEPTDAEPGLNSDVDVDASVDATGDDGTDLCDHAAGVTYNCTPLPLSEGPCQGGPPQAGDAGSDVSYPLGCVATIPMCSPFYPTETLTCSCSSIGPMAMWTCPL